MSDWSYTQEELDRYFNDPDARQKPGGDGGPAPRRGGLFGFLYARFDDPRKAQAAAALLVIALLGLVGFLGVALYMTSLTEDLPSFSELDNPTFQLATIAYTSDGEELARYARENRSWATYDQISPHVINALVSTEDHRFHDHWGIDLFRTMQIPYHVLRGDPQGGSTLSQQLARNLYNKKIGRAVTVPRKLKEMITAVQLERRYTKREIIEMYLNTVEFGYNAFGIEAASRTFYGKNPMDLDPLESATLVGTLKGTTLYNPVTRAENAQRRRNVVLSLMMRAGHIDRAYYDAHKEEPVGARYHSSAVTASLAPYFADHVREWLDDWGEENGHDIYTEGLIVHTTLDSRLQQMAQTSVDRQMDGLQAVVDYEWSRPSSYYLGGNTQLYLNKEGYEPFKYFWDTNDEMVRQFIRESPQFRQLRRQDTSEREAVEQLRTDTVFMDSLRAEKQRLEAGLVSIDPRTGNVKAWVGGRDLAVDWYDHVAKAKRQAGSTFKPFVYTAAIDNGYSPSYRLPDSSYTYVDPHTGTVWRPGNSGGEMTGEMVTLRHALSRSLNTITARLIVAVGPSNVAFYARRMGIESPLTEVPALGLGASDVSLLEITGAYTTLANGGLRQEPVVVARIEDRFGNVLYEHRPTPQEALSEETAAVVVDMMRGVVLEGTGRRIRGQFGMSDYDLAGKTGTTQNSADGWFILMHPDLVTGSWVGFNDRRMTFRTDWWGQGAHNALFLVGDYIQQAANDAEVGLSKRRFPEAEDLPGYTQLPQPNERPSRGEDRGRIRW